ncbi:MAG: AAA family ATPase [Planctomycetota bacterium]
MGHAISKLTIKGYKSIRNLENFELRNLNILIGPNGAGKSNFVSFFEFISTVAGSRMQSYISENGGANFLLHLGVQKTQELKVSFEFNEWIDWNFISSLTKTNNLIFREESIKCGESSYSREEAKYAGDGDSNATSIIDGFLFPVDQQAGTSLGEGIESIRAAIINWGIYHFHNTGDYAEVKYPCSKRDYEYLRPDASNLAAFLLRLKKKHQREYSFIREVIQLAAPFFDDFWLREEEDKDEILLEWRQKGSDYPFHPSQISDGTLRFICLATALLQPNPPSTILLDEPELGLHPYALTLLASLIQKASIQTQVIVSTQSAPLIDHFKPEDIIIVERQNGESIFKRLNKADLKVWLDDYSLGDLWQMNVFGGRPSYE